MEFITNKILREILGLQIKFRVIRIQMVLLVGLDDVTERRTIDRPKKKKKLWIKHMATQYLGTGKKKRRQQKRIIRTIKIKSV